VADQPVDSGPNARSTVASEDESSSAASGAIPVIPNHDLLDLLGEGGMAAVYRARDRRLGRIVAVKVMRDELASPAVLARFQREAEVLAGLNHPHIVKVHDVGHWQPPGGGVELPYLTLEYVSGGNLEDRLDGHPAEPGDALRLIRLLARAVAAAHSAGILHRDLKPSNVLLAPPTDEPALNCAWGWPKLADFGLARRLDSSSTLTHTGAVMGTPSYMAPEQAGGRNRDVSPAIDVYGLGAILYWLLTCKPPFEGNSAVETLYRVMNDEVVPPRRLRGLVSTALDRLCLRCLEKDPARRPALAELIEALDRPPTSTTSRVEAMVGPWPKTISNSIGMKLVLIPAGKFLMGSPQSEPGRGSDEGPQREVEITRPFYLGVFSITQAQWRAVMEYNPSFFCAEGGGKNQVRGMNTDDYPVENVSWEDVATFLEELSALPAEREEGRVYRLPSEAEWEYACRAGTTTAFHYGDSLSSTQANFDGTHPHGGAARGPYLERTCKVGSYKPNAFGLYDMHGNVWEWCADWYSRDCHARSPASDPTGPAQGTDRVFRGGSWLHRGRHCRSADRDWGAPGLRGDYLGFRVVMIASGG
jgi:formylglycine-generating enzyme required for sulfatase activity/tRNA A-37 threonylcarbamoyl transferase component Bud32